MIRKIDHAMAAKRAEKDAVRKLWLHVLQQAGESESEAEYPLYLTLAGAHGHDIRMLIDAGLLRTTEVGSIDRRDMSKVVAVEASEKAVAELQEKFPGLKIVQQSIKSLVRGESPLRWPTGEHEDFCRAAVINLDLNEPLLPKLEHGEVRFPVLELIRKLALLHAAPSPVNWYLCLTLHGEVTDWDEHAQSWLQAFMHSNFAEAQDFARKVTTFWGSGVGPDEGVYAAARQSVRRQQRFLMVLVPKIIASRLMTESWLIRTVQNLSYGGTKSKAPMVTWVLHFKYQPDTSAKSTMRYRNNLLEILERTGEIKEDGSIQKISL